jgi:hypothetical protein
MEVIYPVVHSRPGYIWQQASCLFAGIGDFLVNRRRLFKPYLKHTYILVLEDRAERTILGPLIIFIVYICYFCELILCRSYTG